MYSEKVVEWTLDQFEMENGWRPVRHSIAEVEEFTAYIDSIIEVDANRVNRYYNIKDGVRISQQRREWIQHWVTNEQFMCFADAMYFATRYAYICDVGEEIFRYSPRDSQRILHNILAEFDEQQVSMELFILKARQLGVTSWAAVYFMQRVLFRRNTRAVMASVKQKQSDLIGRIQDTIWQKLPFWLPPPKTVVKTSAPEWANNSIMSIQSGSQAFGIAQGWTPSCVHISEVGDVPNPRKVLEEGLFKAAHSTRQLFFIMEGTGNGDTGWQAEKWRYYKENYGKEVGARFRPVFIPPACARDIYPLPDWLRKNPIPENWVPTDETRRMQRRAELYVRSTDYLAKWMGSNWKMDQEYLWFWDCNWREAVATHTEKIWLGQMPCTDSEALQGQHDRAVKDEVIEIITKERDKQFDVYAITGKTIILGSENTPYEPPFETIDTSKPRIGIHKHAADGNSYTWELVPLVHDFSKDDDIYLFNKLLVFKHPGKFNCSMGIDCADGYGMPNEDRSVVSVVENHLEAKMRDEQVCSFTSLDVNSPQMARIAACLAAWYGEECPNPMGVKMAIEQRRKPGDECQHQLKLMGFYNHHRMVMYDAKGMPDPSKAHKEGFYTNNWSRPMMLNKFLDAVAGGWFKPNDPILIRQLKSIVRVETSGISRIDHKPGEHDDNVFANGMAYFTAHDMDNNAQRQEGRYKSKEEYEEVDLDGWCEYGTTIGNYVQESPTSFYARSR